MACQFCGDETVTHGIATDGDVLAILAAEYSHETEVSEP